MKLIPDSLWGILTVKQEAAGESQDGKTAVAEVILRRTALKYQSDGTVAGTCLQAIQFSGWNALLKGKNNLLRIACAKADDQDPVVQDCQKAWDRAVAGSCLTAGALLYYNHASIPTPPDWVANCDEVAVIGKHHFYVPKGA